MLDLNVEQKQKHHRRVRKRAADLSVRDMCVPRKLEEMPRYDRRCAQTAPPGNAKSARLLTQNTRADATQRSSGGLRDPKPHTWGSSQRVARQGCVISSVPRAAGRALHHIFISSAGYVCWIHLSAKAWAAGMSAENSRQHHAE